LVTKKISLGNFALRDQPGKTSKNYDSRILTSFGDGSAAYCLTAENLRKRMHDGLVIVIPVDLGVATHSSQVIIKQEKSAPLSKANHLKQQEIIEALPGMRSLTIRRLFKPSTFSSTSQDGRDISVEMNFRNLREVNLNSVKQLSQRNTQI
jgi:hypothetical protein